MGIFSALMGMYHSHQTFQSTSSITLLTFSQTAFLLFQLLGVSTFGEAEFWLALLKLVGLVAFYIFSIV